MRGRLVVVAGWILVLALRPSDAHAQMDTFVRAVRDLATATAQPETARAAAIEAASDRMTAALHQWDRAIAAKEADLARDLPGAAPLRAWQMHVELGVAYQSRGRHADALREFDTAAALRPAASDLQVLRGLALEHTGRQDEANQAFRTASALDARNPVKAYYIVRRGGTSAERERAYALLTDTYQHFAVDARPATPPFLTLDTIPDTLTTTPVVGDEQTGEAFRLLVAGRYDDAVTALHHRSKIAAADSALAHFTRGQADEAHNRVAEARREYEAALAGTLTGRGLLYVGLARLAQVEGDGDGAIAAFVQAARINPNDPNVHKELATAYAARDLVDEAFGELMAALLIDPRDAQAHAEIGQLALNAGRNEAAVTAFTRALALAPDRYETHYALATALRRLGHAEDAERELATFETARRKSLEQRRRDIAADVEKEEAVRRALPEQGGGR